MSLETLPDTISDNIMLIFLLLVFLIALLAILRVVNSWISEKKARTIAQFETDMAKLEIAKRKAVMEELRNSAVVLNDDERAKLESIRTDSSILTRKLIFDMNEMEERTRRLELGADTFNMQKMLGDVKGYEHRLFGRKK
jgi:hypothetical protein